MKLSQLRFSLFAATTLLLGASMSLSSCKKAELEGTASEFLQVEKKNSSLLLKHTGTWCAPCGGWGFTQFESYMNTYGATEVLAADVSGSLAGANNEVIFDAIADAFDISSTPTFHANYGQPISANLITQHRESEVVANANYKLEFVGDKIIVKTTTEFFTDLSGKDYYLTPYIIVDKIIADQNGHPDGANTEHHKSIVDVANPAGFDPEIFGYVVAGGDIRAGYKVNLEFEAARLASWDDANISVALVISTRDASGKPVFVNAYTKH